jgi:N-acylethanolamine-hydrolysing acid amidase
MDHGPIVEGSSIKTYCIADPEFSGQFRCATLPTEPPRHALTAFSDLPPEERWKALGELYSNKTSVLIDYIDSVVPQWLMPIVKSIGDDLDRYRGFRDRGDEMKGYAKSLGVPLGYIAFANLFYQLEGIGINCTLRNETGPCPNSSSTSSDSIAYHKFPRSTRGPSGLCTSFVAQDPTGNIWHGRNMDWNLPAALRELYIDVEFTRGGQTLFTATTVVGYVGIFNAVKHSKFSYSMDARDCGGNILENMLEMLLHGAFEPSQVHHIHKIG